MYKVRNKVLEKIYGTHEESYNLLAVYAETLKETNPGTFALVTWHSPLNDNAIHFKEMFVTFGSWIQGFLKGCRPIIGVDGTYLTGRYKGVVLSALTLDANNYLYLVAYALVSKELGETWSYFFRCLRSALQQHGCQKWDWTFISDRMLGVEKALIEEFPLATRRVCAQHLYENFKKLWGSPAYHTYFWTAADATSYYVHCKALSKMAEMDPKSVAWLGKVKYQWSRYSFHPDVACDQNTSNFVESFNAIVTPMKDLPVYRLMEGIRGYFMEKFGERYEVAEKMGVEDYTPWVVQRVRLNCEDYRTCRISKAGGGEFEVLDGHTKFPVDILRQTCLCGAWQVSGIPCKHACRAVYENNEEPIGYTTGTAEFC